MQEVGNSTRHAFTSLLLEELRPVTPLRTSNLILFSWYLETFPGFPRSGGHFDFHVNALRASTSGRVVAVKNRRRTYRPGHIQSILHCRRSYLRLTRRCHEYYEEILSSIVPGARTRINGEFNSKKLRAERKRQRAGEHCRTLLADETRKRTALDTYVRQAAEKRHPRNGTIFHGTASRCNRKNFQ